MHSMEQHATSKDLANFRLRALPAEQMSLVSRHLCRCPACRRAYRAIAAPPSLPKIASDPDRESLHPTYEQICASLDAAPESEAWVLVERHALLCKSCALEVRELRAFDSQLAAPSPRRIEVPAQALQPSFFDELLRFFSAPHTPAFAGAALSLMAVGFFLVFASPAAIASGASVGEHSDSFQAYLAPRSITGAFLLLVGTGGFIYRFTRKTPK